MQNNFYLGPEKTIADNYILIYVFRGEDKIAFATQTPQGNKVTPIKGHEEWLPLAYNLVSREKSNVHWTK